MSDIEHMAALSITHTISRGGEAIGNWGLRVMSGIGGGLEAWRSLLWRWRGL